MTEYDRLVRARAAALVLTCGKAACTEHQAGSLRVFFCNDCGEGYVTDNVGDRTPMCDPCRAEMGLRPRAIEHQRQVPKPEAPYAGPICFHTVGSIGDTMCGIELPDNRDRKKLVYCTRFDDNHREREEVPARAMRAGDVTCDVCDHACMIEFLAG